MKKISTVVKGWNEIFKQPKLTELRRLLDYARILWQCTECFCSITLIEKSAIGSRGRNRTCYLSANNRTL
jgi:hypothetical protein